VPLRLAQDYVAEQNESLREALAVSKGIAERRDFPLATRLHLTHDVSKGIVNAAEVHLGVRLILLGWHGAVTHSRVRWNVDQQVIQSNPGATAVFLNRGLTHAPRKILVPMGGGPHARLGLRLAYQLLPDDGELVAFRVATMAEASAEALEGIADAIRIQIEEEMGIATDGRIAIKAVPGGAGEANIVIEAIAQEAAQGYDLVVIGASDEWRWNNWLFGSIPDQVADQAPCSVLLVRAAQDLGHQLYVPVEEA
jgi:nucleotide-binding universal stress UspA family protein